MGAGDVCYSLLRMKNDHRLQCTICNFMRRLVRQMSCISKSTTTSTRYKIRVFSSRYGRVVVVSSVGDDFERRHLASQSRATLPQRNTSNNMQLASDTRKRYYKLSCEYWLNQFFTIPLCVVHPCRLPSSAFHYPFCALSPGRLVLFGLNRWTTARVSRHLRFPSAVTIMTSSSFTCIPSRSTG